MPSLKILCSSCGSRFSPPSAGQSVCRADGCAAPVCGACARALFGGRCEQHSLANEEKLADARARCAAQDPLVPFVLTTAEAYDRREQALSRFEMLAGQASKILDPASGRLRPRRKCAVSHDRHPPVSAAHSAIAGAYSCFRFTWPGILSSYVTTWELRVLARGDAFERDGFDFTPLTLRERLSATQSAAAHYANLPSDQTAVVGLASLTGWTADVKAEWRDSGGYQQDRRVFMLIDLYKAGVTHYWPGADEPLRSTLDYLADIFSPPGEDNGAQRAIKGHLAASTMPTPALTLEEATTLLGIRRTLAKRIFEQLANTGAYQLLDKTGKNPVLIAHPH